MFSRILGLTVSARCATFEFDMMMYRHHTDYKNNFKDMSGLKVEKKISLIYRNIWIYRLIMNLLYLGRYRQRFKDIIGEMGPNDNNVIELCFGDIYIAAHCKKSGRRWTGYDINDVFVNTALHQGYNAVCADILSLESLPGADVLIFAGSLYHFNENMPKIWQLMTSCAAKIILSEPIKNITSNKNFMGTIGARASTVRNGAEAFRFERDSLINMLEFFKEKHNFTYKIISEKKDILITLHDRNQRCHSGL